LSSLARHVLAGFYRRPSVTADGIRAGRAAQRDLQCN
jgi:hypothetical protein